MISNAFKSAFASAYAKAQDDPNDAIQYLMTGWGVPTEIIPIYLLDRPDRVMSDAAGCADCFQQGAPSRLLGLWADQWPGYPDSPHGMIWLFESGIRGMNGDLSENLYRVLMHESGHALQWDHVLDAMAKAAATGLSRGMTAALPESRGCGCMGGHG